jgi:hypothetical protein
MIGVQWNLQTMKPRFILRLRNHTEQSGATCNHHEYDSNNRRNQADPQ